MLTSLLALPIQVNLVASNCAACVAEQRIEAGAAADDAEGRAVLRARRCRASWRAAAMPAPSHVLRHHGRVAGDVLADVAREHARVEVVGAADAVADVEIDGLALVEVGRRSGRGPLDAAANRKAAASRPRVNAANTMFLPSERLPLCGDLALVRHAAIILAAGLL